MPRPSLRSDIVFRLLLNTMPETGNGPVCNKIVTRSASQAYEEKSEP